MRLYSITRGAPVYTCVEKRWWAWYHVCEQEKHAMESEGTLVDFEVNEWGRVTVRSQDEWDALMRDTPAGARFARIDAPASETVRVLYRDGGITVMAVGESRVVACGVDVRVRDKARVWAGTHVSVHAYDKARVWASGLCVVYAHESARVGGERGCCLQGGAFWRVPWTRGGWPRDREAPR